MISPNRFHPSLTPPSRQRWLNLGAAVVVATALCLFAPPRATAGTVTITLVNPLSLLPGGSLQVFGNITTSQSTAISLASTDLSFTSPPLDSTNTTDDLGTTLLFFGPDTVSASNPLDNFDLFTLVALANATPGAYDASYSIYDSSNNQMADLTFNYQIASPTVATPEPPSVILMLAAVAMLALARLAARRRAQT
jgi:hypothetical protein